MDKFRIIGTNRRLNAFDDLVYYKVQKRVCLFFWKDLRVDSPLLEFETPSSVAAERTLLNYVKEDRELRAIRARDKDLKEPVMNKLQGEDLRRMVLSNFEEKRRQADRYDHEAVMSRDRTGLGLLAQTAIASQINIPFKNFEYPAKEHGYKIRHIATGRVLEIYCIFPHDVTTFDQDGYEYDLNLKDLEDYCWDDDGTPCIAKEE